MIKSIELVRLAIGGNLDNENYTVIDMSQEVSLEKALVDLVCYEYNCLGVHPIVGEIPQNGVTGYLVKRLVSQVAQNPFIGIADAVYEARTEEGEPLLYIIWAIG